MSETYIQRFIAEVNAVTSATPQVYCYGENIDNGSRLSGLARGLEVHPSGKIQNVGNCELTHIGLGMGMMVGQQTAILFAKQLDFMLLGVDHFASTYNLVRSQYAPEDLGSFTILVIICDQGLQGPQSSFNALADLSSMAHVPGYTLNSAAEMKAILGTQLTTPGFRIICVSQSRFGQPLLEAEAIWHSVDGSIFKYREGRDATLVATNFALDHSLQLADSLTGFGTDVFGLQAVPSADLTPLIESVAQTGKLVLLDDSKSANGWGNLLIAALQEQAVLYKLHMVRRPHIPFGLDPERYDVDDGAVLTWLNAA